jgi:hypothetical protein
LEVVAKVIDKSEGIAKVIGLIVEAIAVCLK